LRSLQIQARALGDRTRHEIFQYLVDAGAAVGVAELTAHFGFNHNAIRQHLAKLVDAELVLEATELPAGRGRPRLRYVVNPSCDSRWGVVGPYERLAMLLSEIVRTGDTPVEVGRRAGLRLRLGDQPSDDPLAELMDQMARQGFEPTARHRGEAVDVILESCPFTSAVLTDPDTVCNLHLGLALGIARAVGGIEVEELVPNDPRQAHCRLRCRLGEPAPA
jgi:predicted ArsR family transcriptional regulator